MTKRTILPKTAVLAVLCVLLATPLTVFSQQKPAVPTVHNKKLDEKFLKFCDNDQEKKDLMVFINDVYQQNGSYLGSATIQQNIDLNMFLEFLDGNIEILKRFDGTYSSVIIGYDGLTYYDAAMKRITPEAKMKVENIKNNAGEWIQNNYFKIYSGALNCDHSPDYDEILMMMEDFYKNNTLEFVTDKKMFKNFNYEYVKDFSIKKNSNSNTSVQQNKINTISTIIWASDIALFQNIYKLFYDNNHNADIDMLLNIYMQAIAPIEIK